MSAPIAGHFSLVDHDGRAVTERSYDGFYRLVFFGFTHCKVVCPRALARIGEALALLGDKAALVRPLYVSVDPERDSPAVMKAFLADKPGITGLTGERPDIDAAKQAFRVFARKTDDPDDPEGYAMPHTAITYLMNRDGSYRAHFLDNVDAAELARRIDDLIDR
jgi:protein SCO1/2